MHILFLSLEDLQSTRPEVLQLNQPSWCNALILGKIMSCLAQTSILLLALHTSKLLGPALDTNKQTKSLLSRSLHFC